MSSSRNFGRSPNGRFSELDFAPVKPRLLAAGLREFSFFVETNSIRDLPSQAAAPDPKDSYLLALAEAGRAEFLVTGDKKLLALKHHQSTRIIAPAAMMEALKAKGNL